MRIPEWFWRLFRRKKEPETEPVEERAERFEGIAFLVEPQLSSLAAFEESVLDYMADMLSDKTLIPSYLRPDMAAAAKLPRIAWELARKHRDDCAPELRVLRSAAVEYARRVSTAVLKAQKG